MVNSCCAFGCTKRFKKGDNIGFFCFPLKNKRRLDKWLIALRRANFTPTSASKICGQHFQSGKPNSDENHPDFVPNVFTFAKPSTSLMSFNIRQKALKKRSVIAETSVIQEDRTEAENDPTHDAANALLPFSSKVSEQGDACNSRWTYIRNYYEPTDPLGDCTFESELPNEEFSSHVDSEDAEREVEPITGSCSEATIKRSAMLSFLDSFPSQTANTFTNVVASQPGTSQSFKPTDPLGDCTFESELPNEEFSSHVDSEDAEKLSPTKIKLTYAQERLHLLKELVAHKVTPSDPDHPVDLFYRSVAASVKQFPIMDQIKMQCLVSEMLADIVTKNSGPESSPSSLTY